MIVDLLGYRDWARALYEEVNVDHPIENLTLHWHERVQDCCEDADLTFLIGWSAMVPRAFYEGRAVLVLHPSALPAYRGGSPIQHQMIDGLDRSLVSFFRLDPAYRDVDSGPLVWQQPYDLDGSLAQVLDRISEVGARGVQSIIQQFDRDRTLVEREQDTGGTTRLRRTPEMSELDWGVAERMTARQLHDFVRALQDPYPNAYVVCADGRRLYITETHLEPR